MPETTNFILVSKPNNLYTNIIKNLSNIMPVTRPHTITIMAITIVSAKSSLAICLFSMPRIL